jgi:hypothetical protein
VTKKINRDLDHITRDLHAALKREGSNVTAIGTLLTEAQEQLRHGEWLVWLGENFGGSISTAANYIDARRFVKKFPSVGSLKLRPTALYLLGHDLASPSGLYDRKAIKEILRAAETEWISSERAYEIATSLRKPKPQESIEGLKAEMAAETTAQSEIDDILEGAPPELPAAPEATIQDVILPPFNQAIKTLGILQTKPLEKFLGTEHAPGDIRAIGDFLRAVADAIEQRRKQKAQSA